MKPAPLIAAFFRFNWRMLTENVLRQEKPAVWEVVAQLAHLVSSVILFSAIFRPVTDLIWFGGVLMAFSQVLGTIMTMRSDARDRSGSV